MRRAEAQLAEAEEEGLRRLRAREEGIEASISAREARLAQQVQPYPPSIPCTTGSLALAGCSALAEAIRGCLHTSHGGFASWLSRECGVMQEEQVRASAADQEKRLRRIEEDAAASERRAAIIRSDAETQANRIVRLPPCPVNYHAWALLPGALCSW